MSTGAGSSGQSSDETLLSRWREGDRAALETLVGRYAQPLYRYLRHMSGDPSDAADLFQETFLRVREHREYFNGRAPFRPAVYRVATNLCADRARYRKRHPLETEVLEEAREVAQLRAAVADLTPNQRAVFLLVRYQHLKIEEAAEALGIPVATARSRMHKAAESLLAAVGEEG